MMRLRTALLVLGSFASLAACGDEASDAGATLADTGTAADTFGVDTVTMDTSPGGDAAQQDTGDDAAADAGPDVREVAGALFGLKADDDYLVPGNIAPKGDVAAGGDLVAWVEGEAGARTLMVWDVSTPDDPPRSFAPPTLVNPSQLALSDAYLVYVDDRYGDPDVFAIELAAGAEVTVIAQPGAQEAPAVFGSRVAWEDCGGCVTGAGVPGHEDERAIVERDLSGGEELVRSAGTLANRAPSSGLLDDGQAALAWVSGRATLRLEGFQPGTSATRDVSVSLRDDQQVGRVAVWQGLLAWRPSPLIVNPDSMIVNPDSMYPSDVATTDPNDGSTVTLTVHAEIAASMELAPAAVSNRLAWLEIPPGDPGVGRVILALADEEPATLAETAGVRSFAMGRDFVIFSAPRADNGGDEDVHVLRIPLP